MSFVRTRLSIMMFLEFAIWGAWLPLSFKYVPEEGFTGVQQGFIYNAFPIAAIIAMFFSNQFADRNFAAEKFTAFSHLVGGLAILALPWVHDFWSFFALMLLHCIFYVPTISITNSIAFTHLKDAQREFSLVRLWGTIGWIVVGIPFIFILIDWSKMPAYDSVPFSDWVVRCYRKRMKSLETTCITHAGISISSPVAAHWPFRCSVCCSRRRRQNPRRRRRRKSRG